MDNGANDINYDKPDAFISELKKDAEWYRQNVRHFSTFYNRPFSPIEIDGSRHKNMPPDWTPVKEVLRCYSYMLGQQTNRNFSYLSDSSQGGLQAPLINGMKIPALVNKMIGKMTEFLGNAETSVKGLSKDIVNKKTLRFQLLRLKKSNPGLFQELKELAIELNFNDQELADKNDDDLRRMLEETPQEYGEVVCKQIADKLYNNPSALFNVLREFKDAVVAGLCSMHVKQEIGRVYLQQVPASTLIWDNSRTDEFNRRGLFGGFIEMKTPEEIFTTLGKGLSPTEKDEIIQMSKTSNESFMTQYNNHPTFTWCRSGVNGYVGVGQIACVTMYWKSVHDTRYKKRQIKYKEKVVDEQLKKINDNVEENHKITGDYLLKDICKGTLIGNKYIVNYGYLDNLVEDSDNSGEPLLPIYNYIPDMEMDQYRSKVSRIIDLQDEIDMLGLKIRTMIGKDLGKNYVIHGEKLGVTNAQSIFLDFKANNLTVLNGSTGEIDDPDKNTRYVELVDLTNNSSVMLYAQLSDRLEVQMEQVLSLPKAALGEEAAYIGKQVQQTQIERSELGIVNLYKGFMAHIEMYINHAVEMQKNLAYFDKDVREELEMTIGDVGVTWIESCKNFPFQKFNISVRIGDFSDKDKISQLMVLSQQYLANPNHEAFMNVIRINFESKTSDQAISTFKHWINQNKKTEEKLRAEQFQQQQQLQGQSEEAKDGREVVKQTAEDGRSEQANQAKIEGKVIDAHVKLQGQSNPAMQ